MTEANGGRMTSDERLERQERDLGDPDDTVWWATGGSHKSQCYHDDPDCSYLNQSEDTKDMDRSLAQQRWLAPCKVCCTLEPEASRQGVYQGLLAAIGRYFYHEAYADDWELYVSFDADEPFRPIIDWVMEGKEPTVRAFHLWGVGGGRGDTFSYDYCKDRRIEWDADDEAWVVETSEKYVMDGPAPPFLPREPSWSGEKRRISV